MVQAQYVRCAVRTTAEVVLTGIIAEQDGASVTLVDAKGEKTRIPRDRIDSLRELPTSLMPEKLLDALTPAGAPRPVPLPATTGEVTMPDSTRRRFLAAASAGTFAAAAGVLVARRQKKKALVAITLDLEMSAEYPRRGMTEWNYRKGDLDADTKKYAVERREGREGPRRADPLLRRRADARAGGRGLAEGPRRGRPPGRQPHLRPRQPAGREAGGHPVPLQAAPRGSSATSPSPR